MYSVASSQAEYASFLWLAISTLQQTSHTCKVIACSSGNRSWQQVAAAGHDSSQQQHVGTRQTAVNRCIKVLLAQYLPGWNADFERGLTNHKLRAMACAWLYAQAPPGTKFVGFIQRVLGHTSTSASLYYELVEHKKGQQLTQKRVMQTRAAAMI